VFRAAGRCPALAIAVLGLVAGAAPAARAAPGDLDSTFGVGGKLTLNFGGGDRVSHMAITPDGRIVVVGFTDAVGSGDYAVARFNSNGTPDTSFNSTGKVTLGTQAGVSDVGGGVAVLPNEQVVVTGSGRSSIDFVTERLNANGSVDGSFAGGAGTSVVDFGGDDNANDMVRQTDGKFVMVGSTNVTGLDFAVARLNADGTLDTSFSGDGKLTMDFGGIDAAHAVALAPGGKIVVAGTGADGSMAVTRLNANGTVDPTFAPGTSGQVLVTFGGSDDVANSVAVQPDGKIVLAGSTGAVGSGDFAVARLNADGSLDTSFSGDGKLTLGYAAADEAALGVVVQQNGKIVVLGDGDVNKDFALTRLQADGSIDTGFGSGGTVGVDFGGVENDGALALQADGKIVLAGSTDVHDSDDFALARLIGDPAQGGGPPLTASFTAPTSVRAGNLITLNSAASRGATRFRWDFNGDGRYDYSTTLPYTGLRLHTPGSYPIKLTAVGANGATQSLVQRLTVLVPVGRFAPRGPQVTVSASNPAGLLPNGNTLGTCTPGTQMVFELVEARGCLYHTTIDHIPDSEKALAANIPDLIGFKQIPGCNKISIACLDSTAALNQDIYVAQTMMVNGMRLTAAPGHWIVIFPGIERIESSDASLNFSGDLNIPVPLPPDNHLQGPVNLDVGFHGSSSARHHELSLFDFNAAQQLPSIAGFPIDGQIHLAFVQDQDRYYSALTLQVSLPRVFSTFGDGPPPTGGVEVDADNDHGTVLDKANLHVSEAYIAGVRLSDIDFTYLRDGNTERTCMAKWWKATLAIHFVPDPANEPGGAESGLRMVPPPDRNGIAFCDGDPFSAGADLEFGNPPDAPLPAPEIFPGVFLTSIQFDMQLDNPLLFDGGVGLTAADIVHANGGVLVAFASPRTRYTIKAGDANGTLGDLAGRVLSSTSIAVGGTVSMDVPDVGSIDLGDAHVLYAYPDYLAAAGDARFQTLLFTLKAGAGLELNTRTGRFNVSANGHVCLAGGIRIAGYDACLGALAYVTSNGVLVCADVGGWRPGIGYLFGEGWVGFTGIGKGHGCRPSLFLVQNVQGARDLARRTARVAGASGRAAASPRSIAFKVRSGEVAKNVELVGAGGPPVVKVTAPDGETITTVPNLIARGRHLAYMSSKLIDKTFIGVNDPRPGTYVITPMPGSPAIRMLAETLEHGTTLTASVAGPVEKRVLTYNVGSTRGQIVHFYEQGSTTWHEIGSAHNGRGRLHFTPQVGPGGTRKIVALVQVGGLPAPPATLARFRAPPEPLAGRVRRLTVRHVGNRLVINWQRAANAMRYALLVIERNGVQRRKYLPGRTHRLVVSVSAIESGRVKVAGLGPLGDWGKAGTAKFRSTRKPQSRSLPYSELRRRKHRI
jgi:uncharacterized delta-60 repeat protein